MVDPIPDPLMESYRSAIKTLEITSETTGVPIFKKIADLFTFSLLERGQLYGLVAYYILEKGLYEEDIDVKDIIALFGYNVAMLPKEDGNVLHLVVNVPKLDIGEE